MGRRNKVIQLRDYMAEMEQARAKTWQEERDDSVESRRQKVRAKTVNQGRYLKAIETSVVTLCIGPAGTGKTYMACGVAAEMLREGRIERIVLTRPIQGCDEDPGFLPGDVLEKYGPIVQPMIDAFGDFLSKKEIEEYRAKELIEIVPLAFMRGRTFHNAMVILDEAQNATFGQLRMFMTRLGHNSRIVINGDHTQSDLKTDANPLHRIIKLFQERESFKLKPISVVRLTREDIVRNPLIQWIDETLTGDFDKGGHEDSDWHTISCPECSCDLWYESKAESKDADPLVRCWKCRSIIELLDGDGLFDPEVIEEAGELHPFPTRQEKP